MASPPICTKCKNVALRFNDDGTGLCNVCSRSFIWNKPGVPKPPVCRRCKTHSLSFMPVGYGWCQDCSNKFIWRPDADIDLTELEIPLDKVKESKPPEAAPIVIEQHFHGDYIQEGASKIAISDSVIQRSNIGADIKVNEGLDEKIQWLDEQNQKRTSELKRGQMKIGKNLLEIKGLTKEMAKDLERHFGELMKDLPYPSNITRGRAVVEMEYSCSRNGEYIGTVKDRRWTRWVHLAIGAAMTGLGIATFSAEMSGKGIKKLLEDLNGKPLDDIPKENLFLTTEEKDEIVTRLRDEGILAKMNYCPACHNWVCKDCFDSTAMMCIDHVE